MTLQNYINKEYGVRRGALQAFADDIGRPYQSVQRWIKNGYNVKKGCVVKKTETIVHRL